MTANSMKKVVIGMINKSQLGLDRQSGRWNQMTKSSDASGSRVSAPHGLKAMSGVHPEGKEGSRSPDKYNSRCMDRH